MPTGSGKTWLAELAIMDVLQRGMRAVYLTPLRALASELAARWQMRFPDAHVGVFTGDYGQPGRAYPVSFRDARLMIMTPERFDACTRAWRAHWGWIPEVDLVVVDELHLLGDRHRGARLEGALSRIRRLNPFARMLGLSATLGNRHELAEWLDGVEYASNWRPIPLSWRVVRYRQATDKPALLADEVARNTRDGGRSLVFVQSRRRAEELNQYLSVGGHKVHHHHAGLTLDRRREVEARFRAGEFEVLVATATLEMGLNLPVRQVVLYDLQAFDGSDFRPLPTNSVWQRVGRAGRPGLDTTGEAVLLAPTWDRGVERYIEGRFEPIRSGLADPSALAEQIIAEVASGLSRSPAQLRSALGQSLAAHQGLLPDIDHAIAEMRAAGMIRDGVEDEGERRTWSLKVTRLGRIAARHMLAPATLLLFWRVLDGHQEPTFLDLLITAACSPDCEPVLPVDFEDLDKVAEYLSREPSHLLQMAHTDLLKLLAVSGRRLLAAINMALVARDWTRTADPRGVADRHGCYPFEVERLRESLDRLLLAMSAVLERPALPEDLLAWAEEDHIPVRERIRALRQMVCAGLDKSAVTLTIVNGVGPTIARRLQVAGIGHIEDLALAEPEDLISQPRISRERAERWIAEAVEIIRSRSALRYVETGAMAGIVPSDWPADIDPYRLRRALDLRIAGADGGHYLVQGGLEPHIVRTSSGALHCDCADAGRSQWCKHVLAVRMHRGERELYQLARRLDQSDEQGCLSLFALWYDSQSVRQGVVPR